MASGFATGHGRYERGTSAGGILCLNRGSAVGFGQQRGRFGTFAGRPGLDAQAIPGTLRAGLCGGSGVAGRRCHQLPVRAVGRPLGLMRIEQLTLRELHMNLVAPFQTSMETTTTRRIVLAEAIVDGVTGWGECVA